MEAITYTKPHNLTALTAELLAAIPSLRPTVPEGGTIPVTPFSLSGDGQTLTLIVPDGTDRAAIDAVVAAHTNPPPPPPLDFGTDAEDIADRSKVEQAIAQLRAYLQLANPTNAQTVGAFKLLIRVVLAMLRRMV